MSLNDFELLSQIGDGYYSKIYKVKRIYDNHIYALKKAKLVDLTDKEINHAINQVRMLASIRHPNVIGYKQAFYDLPSKSLCIIMEYADGGDLQMKITDHRNKGLYFKEDYIWDVFGQILSGISKLHDLGILHRDIKSANVYIMRNGLVKLGDLNASKVVRKDGMCETQTGAPYYSSPQVWRKQAYDIKADAWSLGCILYELINLKVPFRARDMQGLYKKVNRGFYPRINKSYSQDLAQVIKRLLTIDPNERISCRQLLQMPLVIKNMKKPRDSQLQQKSALLRTIKVGKNISYIGEKMPLPNYTPLKYKQSSLGKIEKQRKITKSLSMSMDKKNQNNLSKSKIGLPPVTSNHSKISVKNNSKLINSTNISPSKSLKRQISSQKINPRYKKSHSSHVQAHKLQNVRRYKDLYQ